MTQNEILIRGLTENHIKRILRSVSMHQIAYANIKSILFVQVSECEARVIFDKKEEWNFDFQGNIDDFFSVLSGNCHQ